MGITHRLEVSIPENATIEKNWRKSIDTSFINRNLKCEMVWLCKYFNDLTKISCILLDLLIRSYASYLAYYYNWTCNIICWKCVSNKLFSFAYYSNYLHIRWVFIVHIFKTIWHDNYKLYKYLENIVKRNPISFFATEQIHFSLWTNITMYIMIKTTAPECVTFQP